jgi:hypothetical protein
MMTADNNVSTLAVVAACMAKGLTPEQTDEVFVRFRGRPIPERASEIQRILEDLIAFVSELQ